ncbi:hypothetical protein A1332_14655 [Methylomonas methanica]|uniref:Uncharacterized protein n=1 Tax=Methylomonas methanica TaxID=421 RepID=A0A177MHA8_METMH|nr:hypothetical protein A1332_14655 [Methylomonas methanica]
MLLQDRVPFFCAAAIADVETGNIIDIRFEPSLESGFAKRSNGSGNPFQNDAVNTVPEALLGIQYL